LKLKLGGKLRLEISAEIFSVSIFFQNASTVENCRLYVALFPCNECAKMIIQSGIKEVREKPEATFVKKSRRQLAPKESLCLANPGLPDFSWYMRPKLEKCNK
jgi:deoxycytidylate deaminase